MRIALASLFSSQNAAENVRLLLHSLEALEDSAELIVFGRQFLQNSDQTGLPENSPLLDAICQTAARYRTGISFGYCERMAHGAADVQVVIGPDGKQLCKTANGEAALFSLGGKSLLLSECEKSFPDHQADAVLWPLNHTCNAAAWNSMTKFDYTRRATLAGRQVLLVNTGGGALHVQDGRIRLELPCGEQGYLFANI